MTKITIFESVEYFSMKNAIFADAYDELSKSSVNGEVPFKLMMSKFGLALCQNVDAIKAPDLKHIFKIVELYLTEGSEELISGIKTCFLDALLKQSNQGCFDFSKIARQLGKKTTDYCTPRDQPQAKQ